MNNYPQTALDTATIEQIEQAAHLILLGKSQKTDISQLRLTLVEIQALRWDIGVKMAKAKGFSRDTFRDAYNLNKNKKMSPNAAYKEAEADENVIMWKNTRDLLETAYEVLQNFVNTNQTSVRLATEEAKNNL